MNYMYLHIVKCMFTAVSDQQIMNELLLHESGLRGLSAASAGPSSTAPLSQASSRYSSSSEGEGEGEEGEGQRVWEGAQPTLEKSEDESSDEEFTMKVL